MLRILEHQWETRQVVEDKRSLLMTANDQPVVFLHNVVPMQHVEFFDREHFEYRFYRQQAGDALGVYIDFFWETRFDHLWEHHECFTDALFPNIGYTYMINLGTPFRIQLDDDAPYTVKSDAFVPRYRNISTHHSTGNRIFGIKFTISPVVLEKNVDFSEYTNAPSSLAYLIAPATLKAIRQAANFDARVKIAVSYYRDLIRRYEHSSRPVTIVRDTIAWLKLQNQWSASVTSLAQQYDIDIRTLQRYFESTTSISTKQAIQIIRIRSAITALIDCPESFDCRKFGYYDNSHFYKQMHQFFGSHPAFNREIHIPMLHRSPVKVRY